MNGPVDGPVSGPLQRAAARVYAENGWPADEMADGSGFTLFIEGTDAEWSALALTDDASATFAFYSLAPVDAPADGLVRMAEFVNRANHGLLSATFELDHDTGEVRLRTGLELATLPPTVMADEELLAAIVLDLSAANVGVMDHYVSGLVAVALGQVDPAEIILELEQPVLDD